jgi:hypothetical protein
VIDGGLRERDAIAWSWKNPRGRRLGGAAAPCSRFEYEVHARFCASGIYLLLL